MSTFQRTAILPLIGLLAATASGELPSPRFDRLTPLGAGAGTTVDVEVAGGDLEGLTALRFDHPGLTATLVPDKPNRFRVAVAPDVPSGTYDARCIGRFGVSNPRLFAVTRGLTDVTEQEPNNESAKAQKIAVNSAVNGTSDGNGEDLFAVPLVRGQRIIVHCQAMKLDSMLDANLVLSAEDGRQLASNSDYFGADPFLDFVAPADGTYLINVFDLSYRGGFPYRLLVSDRPHAENVWPRAVRAGQPVELTVFGRNLGAGAQPSPWTLDAPLEQRTFSFAAPADAGRLAAFRFLEHPTDHTVLPTAATCTLTGLQLATEAGIDNAQTVLVSDDAVVLETEPNDVADQPQPVVLPLVLSGRFDKSRDADWFEFVTDEAGSYGVEVYCERIGGRADPYVVIQDEQGNRVSELDDFGHRSAAFDGHLRDPSGSANLGAKKKYRLLVQDRYRRGGARNQYVLSLRRPVPDFYAAAIHPQNPGPGGTTLWRGGATLVDVIVHNRDGFSQPIVLTAENLPPGLHAAPTTLTKGTTRSMFVLWADADAPEWTGPVSLIATSQRGDEPLRREVRPYTRVWNNTNMNSSRPARDWVVAVREKAPFALRFVPPEVTVAPGKPAEVKLVVERLWPEFTGDVNVSALNFPNGFSLPNAKVTPGQSEIALSLPVPMNATGMVTLHVQGQAQVPFHKDPQAKERPNTLVTMPSQPLTLRVQP